MRFTLLRPEVPTSRESGRARGFTGFRPGFAEVSKDSTCVANATPAQQVAPRLPVLPIGFAETRAAGSFH